MTTRTTQTVGRFSSPFLLPGFDAHSLPANIASNQDEELIEVFSRLAWRRVGAFVHLPAMVPVNPADLDAVLEKDQEQS